MSVDFWDANMKRVLISLILLMSVLPITESHATEPIKTEAMLILLAGFSATDPDTAAVIDVLALALVPSSTEYKTNTQRYIAYAGLGALAFYNYDAKDNGYSEETICAANLLVFNIVLAGELFGFNDGASNFTDVEEPGGTFNFQLTPTGGPEINWQYRF